MSFLRVTKRLTLRHTRKMDYLITPEGAFEVDATAQTILELCDGTRTHEHLVAELANMFAISSSEVCAALDPFIAQMQQQGILEWRSAPAKIRPFFDPHLPSSAAIELTSACNQQCVYCVNHSGQACDGEMSLPEFDRLLDELIAWEVGLVNITGGEPLLCKEIVQHLVFRLANAGVKPFLLTNGTLVTPSLAKDLYSAGLRDAQVSIDSLDAPVLEQRRHYPDVLKTTIQGMEFLKQAGIQVTAAVVITPQNYASLPAIHEWIIQNGYLPWVGPIIPIGRGEAPAFKLSPMQMLGMRSFLATGSLQYRGPFRTDVICRETCSVGTSPVISPLGDVYPCYQLRQDPFRLGNIRQQSLGEIWATSDLLQELMHWNIDQVEGCKDCWNKLFCGGGCRGCAYAHHKTIYASDPSVCAANKRLAKDILRQGEPGTKAAMEELVQLATTKVPALALQEKVGYV